MEESSNREKEIEDWLNQVHFGSCCSDDPEECDLNEAAAGDKKTNSSVSLSTPHEQVRSDSQ